MEHRIELLPGVYLRMEHTTRFKTGIFSLSMLRPISRGESGKNALLANVLMRGTAKHPDIQSISRFLDRLYGASAGPLVRKNGEVQTCGFLMSFMEDRFALAGDRILESMVGFLGEVLLDPLTENGAFSELAVEGEKQNLINLIASEINDKRVYADKQMRKAMFGDDPAGISRLGEIADIQSITPRELYDHYCHILAHSPVEIFYSGGAEPEKVAQLFRRALAGLPRKELESVTIRGFRGPGEVKYLEQTMPVTQGKLSMGFVTGITCRDPGFPAMVVLNGVFGAGATSKLFLNVREKLSLCYYASSAYLSTKGILTVSSGIETGNYQRVKEEILRQLEACREGNITREELESAKKALCSSLESIGDSQGRMEDYYLFQVLTGFSMSAREYCRALEQVTVQQVQQAARGVHLDTIFFLKGDAK